MKFPHETFDDYLEATESAAVDVGVLLVARNAGRAGEQLVAGLAFVDVLGRVAVDRERGVVLLPQADVERFAPELGSDCRPDPGAMSRLIRFEVERANGMLDSAYNVVGPLPLDQRLRLSWIVGGARARLQALARRPDPFAPDRPRPWRTSHVLATFRTLRRAHHRRGAPQLGRQ